MSFELTAEGRVALEQLAVQAVREAGALLWARFGQATPYRTKSSQHDLVTEADLLAEEKIIAHIRRSFPDHGIVSEERPPREAGSPYRWVIDPVDGTTNYAHGIPFFSISVALEEDERPIVGVVYDPVRGELFTAQVGGGARLNGRPIAVSPEEELRRSLLATGFPYVPELRDLNLKYFEALLPATQGLRRLGSAALSLAYVAAGRLEGYWDLDLNRWDLAAGILLVQEAGGRVSDLAGGGPSPDRGELVASNGWVHQAILERFGAA